MNTVRPTSNPVGKIRGAVLPGIFRRVWTPVGLESAARDDVPGPQTASRLSALLPLSPTQSLISMILEQFEDRLVQILLVVALLSGVLSFFEDDPKVTCCTVLR